MSARHAGRVRLSYLLYAALLTVVLLYIRFPSAGVQKYIGGKVETAFPGLDITAGAFRYVFPTTMQFDRILVSTGQGGDEVAELENLAVSPVMAGLGLEYSVSGDLYGGDLQLGLKLSPTAGKYRVEALKISGVDLRKSPFAQKLFQREIEGEFDFAGTAAGSFSGEGGGFDGEVIVHDGAIPLRQPILLVSRMDFQELAAKVSYESELLKLADGSLKGQQFNVDYSGSLRTTGIPESWQLDVSGSLIPQQDFTAANQQVQRLVVRLQKQFRKNDLPFMLNGSIVNPRFRFGSQ